MLTWVIYDISKTKTRNRVVKSCLKAGIYRVQKSVFLGDINKTQVKQLQSEFDDLIDADSDSIYIFPMCKDDFKQCLLLGQAFSKELVSDEIKVLFL